MPTSDRDGKNWALDTILKIDPLTVVDVGAGEGTYYDLAARKLPTSHWTAIEVWGPYVDQYGLDELYDDVIVADARWVVSHAYEADLAIFGDCLEHMTHGAAAALVHRVQSEASNILVSVPVLHLPQGAVNRNPYERHREGWHWTADQMRAMLGYHLGHIEDEYVGDVLAYFWWQR